MPASASFFRSRSMARSYADLGAVSSFIANPQELMPSKHDESTLAEAVGKRDFHELRLPVRHGIEVCVQFRHEPLTEPLHNPRSFHAVLVILESPFWRQPGHPDVVSGFAVTVRVA